MYLNFVLCKSCYRTPGEMIHKILIVDYSVVLSNIPVSEVYCLQLSESSFQTFRSCESRYTWDVTQNNGHLCSTTPQPALKRPD